MSGQHRRLRRGLPAKGQGRVVVLTPRDHDLFLFLALTRYAATGQLARAFFPSRDRSRRRLRALLDTGYLKVTLWGSQKDNLLSLTAKGLKAVKEAHPELQEELFLPGAIRLSGVPHHLAVIDTRLYLAALCGETSGTRLVRWASPGSALYKPLRPYQLRPDGLCLLLHRGAPHWLAVEVDLGTESLSTLERKAGKYEAACGAGHLQETWWVVRAGRRRQEHVKRLLVAAGLGPRSRVLGHELTLLRPAVAPPARLGQRDRATPTSAVGVQPESAPAGGVLSESSREVEPLGDAAERTPERRGPAPASAGKGKLAASKRSRS